MKGDCHKGHNHQACMAPTLVEEHPQEGIHQASCTAILHSHEARRSKRQLTLTVDLGVQIDCFATYCERVGLVVIGRRLSCLRWTWRWAGRSVEFIAQHMYWIFRCHDRGLRIWKSKLSHALFLAMNTLMVGEARTTREK